MEDDILQKAMSIFKRVIDNKLWLQIKEYYDKGAYNNRDLNPNNTKIFDFESITQRINFWMNVYEQDMISEGQFYTTLVSKQLNQILIEKGYKDEYGNYKPLSFDDEKFFISRLDGEVKEKIGKTIGEEPPPDDPIWSSFSVAGDILRNERQDDNPLSFLYQQWGFPKETIDIIFNEFDKSYDETNSFLHRVDGMDGDTLKQRIKLAWEQYCQEFNITDIPSTNKFCNLISYYD